jgi:hypothetical protein
MRVRRQTAFGKVDPPPIEKLTARRNSDEHRRVAVLGDANARGWLRSSSRHVFCPPGDRKGLSRPSFAFKINALTLSSKSMLNFAESLTKAVAYRGQTIGL